MLCTVFVPQTCLGQAHPFPHGKASQTIKLEGVDLQVYTFRPEKYNPAKHPLILVFHGHSRSAESYRNSAITLTHHLPGLVVAPLFDDKQFPGNHYTQGDVLTKDGSVRPKKDWTFSVVPRLIKEVQQPKAMPACPTISSAIPVAGSSSIG